MSTYTFQPTRYYNAIGWYPPVLRVAPGETVVTTTVDAAGADEHGASITPGGNPQTGPFFVEGAEPGDTLVIHLERLTPSRATGFTRARLSSQVFYAAAARVHLRQSYAWWDLDLARGTASIRLSAEMTRPLTVPIAPMLGCFGVAPTWSQMVAGTALLVWRRRWPRQFFASGSRAISTATSGRYGGNMDYRGFCAGTTVYFPVFVPGALFFLGDGHAAQGDGELLGNGIETSFEVQFTVDLLKGQRIGWPRGENAEYLFTVGNGYPLQAALRWATTEMYRWLQEKYMLDARASAALLGMGVEYEVGNVVSPAYTMVCKLPKRFL
jgi:amidase